MSANPATPGTPHVVAAAGMALVLLAALVAALVVAPPAAADSGVLRQGWTWPLRPQPAVVRGFEPPDSAYGPGHRGVDLAGAPGAWVYAVADGVVRFTGTVAGVGVVSVDHGDVVSTYQPVSPEVGAGEQVRAGEVLGHLLASASHCAPRACLHLGRKLSGSYADPLALLGSSGPRIRLMTPYGAPPEPPSQPASAFAFGTGASGAGDLARPVAGPVTSPYGMRTHPLTGVYKLHDGTDLGAPCGTPVRAATGGTVDGRDFNAAYGNRVSIAHPRSGGHTLTTTYNHLNRAAVRTGQRVRRGQVVGFVGQSGYATGCHLHFMVLLDGSPVDPEAWLS